MSGGRFRARGATGPAPTTAFFGGGLADRLNMIYPSRADLNSYSVLASANYLNQWEIWNLSYGGGGNVPTAALGGFTTAPDGSTDKAQKLVETTANTMHFTCAGCQTDSGRLEFGKFRFAGFFKYAGRRVAITACTPIAGGMGTTNTPFDSSNGFRAIFDLANGQVGVDTYVIRSVTGWTAEPAVIRSFGNGWYLCYFDVYIQSWNPLQANGESFYCYVQLDNGTGTGPASLSYAGDGSSGVYGWRTNVMPPLAWGMNGQVFFEDFLDDTRANFDLANTLDPTKTWFIRNGTPYVPNIYDPVTPIDDIPVSGSVLHIKPTIAQIMTLTSFAALDQNSLTGGYVGKGWKAPFFFECRTKWDMANDATDGLQTATLWSWSIEYATQHPDPSLSQGLPAVDLIGREIDLYESSGGGGGTSATPRGTMLAYWQLRQVESKGRGKNGYGAVVWDAVHSYSANVIVVHGGNYYKSKAGFNLNNPPPNATWWDPYTGLPPMVTLDWNQFQVIQGLVIPYTPGDVGKYMLFCNNQFTSIAAVWSPDSLNTEPMLCATDKDTMPILLGGANSFDVYFDWVRVTQ